MVGLEGFGSILTNRSDSLFQVAILQFFQKKREQEEEIDEKGVLKMSPKRVLNLETKEKSVLIRFKLWVSNQVRQSILPKNYPRSK